MWVKASLFRMGTFVWSVEQLPFRLGMTCSVVTRLLQECYRIKFKCSWSITEESLFILLLVNVKLVGITFRPLHFDLLCSICGGWISLSTSTIDIQGADLIFRDIFSAYVLSTTGFADERALSYYYLISFIATFCSTRGKPLRSSVHLLYVTIGRPKRRIFIELHQTHVQEVQDHGKFSHIVLCN